MTDRASARHRASERASTPLTQLGGTIADRAGTLGRTGAVVAASSGLLAAAGLPAQATSGAQQAGVQASVQQAGLTTGRLLSAPNGSALLTSPTALDAAAPVSAPVTAALSFETQRFTAVPAQRPVRPVVRPAPAAAAQQAVAQPATRREARDAERAAAKSAKSTTKKASTSKASKKSSSGSSASNSSIVSIARGLKGIPYKYGGTTTGGFDCSGFTGYVYKKAGLSLPRTSGAQYSATRRVSDPRPGDLVFFLDGGSVYHVGIYTGGGKIIDSPRSGKSVSEREIWSDNVAYGRL